MAATSAFEKVSSYGLLPNMILYLRREYRLEAATGANILFFWSAATNLTPIIGAFLADSYFGRFPVIAFGSAISLLVIPFNFNLIRCLDFLHPSLLLFYTSNLHILLIKILYVIKIIGMDFIRKYNFFNF